jgi:Domain of unknown function (DUF3471)
MRSALPRLAACSIAALFLILPSDLPADRPSPEKLDRGDGKEKQQITVTAEGDTLKVEPKGQARLLAIPESETRFYLKPADATVEFTRDAKGVVTHLTLLQDNQYSKALRTEPSPAARAPAETRLAPTSQPAKQPVSGSVSRPGARP